MASRRSLLVAEEVFLDGEPGVAGVGALGDDGGREVVGDGVVEPRLDGDVHPNPVGEIRNTIAENVFPQRVLGDGEQELLAPARVVFGVGVKDDRHEGTSVQDGDSLGVEVEDGGGLMKKHGLGVASSRGGSSSGP